MKLTKPWKKDYDINMHLAELGNITLICRNYPGLGWRGEVIVQLRRDDSYWRYGEEFRRYFKLAKKDTEKLAVQLQQDIIDGAREIMSKYGMGKDEE